ncbi:MAG: hypothetical protein CSB44_04860 [Gammaproteobacteria bacterium]|nr:MAG: hypothetical protein CSB44_04860 [Gammaproteobacteria bacterium]
MGDEVHLAVSAVVGFALLAVPPVVSSKLDSASESLERTSFLDWSGERLQNSLPDGSTLTRYTAVTTEADVEGTELAVEFSPRFGCSPHVRMRFDSNASRFAAITNLSSDELNWQIGHEYFRYPVVADTEGDNVVLHLVAVRSDREALVTALAGGSRVSLSLPGRGVEFSLLGSRRTLVATRAHCLRHEPLPFDEPRRRVEMAADNG